MWRTVPILVMGNEYLSRLSIKVNGLMILVVLCQLI